MNKEKLLNQLLELGIDIDNHFNMGEDRLVAMADEAGLLSNRTDMEKISALSIAYQRLIVEQNFAIMGLLGSINRILLEITNEEDE